MGNDWGSTAIRLCFYYIEEQRLDWVNNRAASNKCDETRYHNGSWSGYIDVSGNGPVYTGDDVPSAFQIPAKLIIGKGKGIDKTNPLLAVMKRNKGDAAFKRRCEEGPVAAVRTFAAQIEMHVQSKNKPLEIVDFGLTVPAHWTLDEMENYAKVLKRGLPRSLRQGDSRLRNLYFMTEVEAFAHFFFHDPDRVEEVLGDVIKHFVLFLDFGGHSMVIVGRVHADISSGLVFTDTFHISVTERLQFLHQRSRRQVCLYPSPGTLRYATLLHIFVSAPLPH